MRFFNTKEWPIIYLRSIEEFISDELFESYKKEYLQLLIKCKNNEEKIILICDFSFKINFDNLPFNYIIKHANFNKEIFKYNKEYVKAICILCNNSTFKNILNLYFTISKPASPYKLCKNYEKANKYLLENFNIDFNTSKFININHDNSNIDDSNNSNNNSKESVDLSELNINVNDLEKKSNLNEFNEK
jgi:hypothetical protein